MKSLDPEWLGDQGKSAQTQGVFSDVVGIEHPDGQAIAKEWKGDSSDPSKGGVFREKDGSDVVDRHSRNGDDFDKVGIQIGFEFDWDAGFHGGVLLCAGVIDVLQEKIRFPKKESGFGGEKGIRTLDTFIGYTRFPIVRLRPAQPSLQASCS